MGPRIVDRRHTLGTTAVFGLLDRDFDSPWDPPQSQPRVWDGSDGVHLGWRWERKEIENYIIDPEVVNRALGASAPPADDYRHELDVARRSVGTYQAARASLATSRRRFRPMPSAFGLPRGRDRHIFPNALDEASCRQELRATVAEHHAAQEVRVADVEAAFDVLLPDFAENGIRFEQYMTAFAGKDLLFAMSPSLVHWGFASASVFVERILIGITQSADDIANWLPEWAALRAAVVSVA
jgi:hypothetical protein